MAAVLLTEWARLLIDTLASSGVRDVVVSPGSRSTPFVWAALTHPELECHSVIDERSAAFFALGQAKLTGVPSLLIATSGSAPAHYLPAVIEAAYSYTPLLVLSADRPPELQHRAVPQTIDQSRLFERFARGSFELGAPQATPTALRALQANVAQAVRASLSPLPGPVQLNAPAHKPLEPLAASTPEDREVMGSVSALIERGPTSFSLSDSEPSRTTLEAVLADLGPARRGLIVCGEVPAHQPSLGDHLLGLARLTGFPLLAEAPSQLCFGPASAALCAPVDGLLSGRDWPAQAADLVLEFGPPLTSQAWASYQARAATTRRHVIARHGWPDVTASAVAVHCAEPGRFIERLNRSLPPFEQLPGAQAQARRAWLDAFRTRAEQAGELVERALAELQFGEAHAVREVCARVPAGSVLVIGNSLPLRGVDAFAAARPDPIKVSVQRGANGIDGLVSGAAGVASRAGVATTLLLGDVSLAHDVGGLMLARGVEQAFVIVVLDNAGGRIFDELPWGEAAGASPKQRDFWTTPPRLDFEALAQGYGVAHASASSAAALAQALEQAYTRPRATLIRVSVPPDSYHLAIERARRWDEVS